PSAATTFKVVVGGLDGASAGGFQLSARGPFTQPATWSSLDGTQLRQITLGRNPRCSSPSPDGPDAPYPASATTACPGNPSPRARSSSSRAISGLLSGRRWGSGTPALSRRSASASQQSGR